MMPSKMSPLSTPSDAAPRVVVRALIVSLSVALAVAPVTAARADTLSPEASARVFARAHAPYRHGGGEPGYVPGEVLVEYRAPVGALVSTAAARVKAEGITEANVLGRHGLAKIATVEAGDRRFARVRISTEDDSTVEAALDALAADGEVSTAQPNYIYHALLASNDPKNAEQWGMKNFGQTIAGAQYPTHNPGTSGNDMNLEGAWDVNTDCSSVPIAVIDTGINTAHEDLAANLWDGGSAFPNHGQDFIDSDNDPRDLNGHGSHVAGIIAARGNNGAGTTGVCWKAKLMALRALDADGVGTTATLIRALDFAVAHGAKVANLSIGTTLADPLFKASIQRASDAGVIVVAASGNDAVNIDAAISSKSAQTPYPCAYTIPNLICVGALDQNFELASFSNYGKTTVHYGAPGANILSAAAGTPSVQTSNFHAAGATTTNWTVTGGGWGYGSRKLTGGDGTVADVDMLMNPIDWNGTSAKAYASNADSVVMTGLTLKESLYVSATFSMFADVRAGDALTFDNYFDGETTKLSQGGFYKSTATPISQKVTLPIARCKKAGICRIGFDFTSDASGVGMGAAIYDFSITSLLNDPSSYQLLSGTSMAAPAVAGLVALIASANPSYTPAETLDALREGGRATASLKDTTITGKAVNAAGSLLYVPAVKGLAVKVN